MIFKNTRLVYAIAFFICVSTTVVLRTPWETLQEESSKRELNHTLWKSLNSGDLSSFRTWLKQGGDVNIGLRVDDDYPPIRYIDIFFKRKKARRLFTANSMEATPLQIAIYRKDKNMVSDILRLGANPNYCQDNMDTPLLSAIAGSNLSIIFLLIKNGADPNLPNGTRSTPLYRAYWISSKNRLTVIKTLIENGADLQAQTYSGKSFINFARYMNDPEVLKIIATTHKR